jgi:UDP-MurNAc hydroxylase
MKITHLASATVLVETRSGVRILMDPWLTDGEYYGSWCHYPPFSWDEHAQHLVDVDYIYISHIHPDHCSRKTMERLPRSAVVLMHRYDKPVLRHRIEQMGFRVVELVNGGTRVMSATPKTKADDPVPTLQIFAADNCDPVVCGLAFGCDAVVGKRGSAQIDSLCVLQDGEQVLVNVNDCPYELARHVLPKVKATYHKIDFLLTGYSGAGPYPQCFAMPETEKAVAAEAKRKRFLEQAADFCQALQPRYVMPFAGQYTLAGRLAHLNDWRGVPEAHEAAEYLRVLGERPVLLNHGATFDLDHGMQDQAYDEPDMAARERYIHTILVQHRFDYDDDPMPGIEELKHLLEMATVRMFGEAEKLGLRWESVLIIDLVDGWRADIALPNFISYYRGPQNEVHPPYVRLTINPRLLKRLLSGPKHAHWNRAEIGSHIQFERVPDIYDRALYRALHSLHA